MSILEKITNGFKTAKWALSKNGREYIKDQKEEQQGIDFVCTDKNCTNDHKHKEGKI